MLKEIGLINYPVKDLVKAKQWYEAMHGVKPYMDSDVYVGYLINGINVGLNPNGYEEGMTGPVIFWKCGDIISAVDEAVNNGATISREPRQLGSQILASLVGADGILFGFIQILNN